MEKVFIILINYNGMKVTTECIDSLKKMDVTRYDYHVVLVDNASTDGSGIELLKAYENDDKISVICSKENAGFAGGNNVGIKYAYELGADFVCMLNNDTEVKEDFLNTYMDCFLKDSDNNKKPLMLAPKINFFWNKDESWYAEGFIDKNKAIVGNGEGLTHKKVDFASGCCVLFNKKVTDKIGLMAEDYFMYCEDMDYSLRATGAGIDIYYTPDTVIYHKVGKTSGGEKSKVSIYYNNRNRLYLLKDYDFSLRAKLYTHITRFARYVSSFVNGSEDRIIKEAYRDFKKGIKGKKEF